MEKIKGQNKAVLIIIFIIIFVLATVYLVTTTPKSTAPILNNELSNDLFTNDPPLENEEEVVNDQENNENNNNQENNDSFIEKDNDKKEEPRDPENNNQVEEKSFIQCLVDAGVIIYGTRTCPACFQLIENFGGYSVVDPIFIDCNQNWDKCDQGMQTTYVPEIQIKGVLFLGQRTPEALAEETGCKIK